METGALPAWLPALAGLIGAALGAIVNQVYRDYRDRPVLHLAAERVRRARRPVALPEGLRAKVYPLGDLKTWLDNAVKWDVNYAFEENRYTVPQLRDMMNVLPKYLASLAFNRNRIAQLRANLANPQRPPTPAASDALTVIRSTWAKRHPNDDLFVAYDSDPIKVVKELDTVLQGDLEQYADEIEAVQAFMDYLTRGFSPDASPTEKIVAPIQEPESVTQPYLLVEILVQNSGRTETLLQDRATLRIGKDSYSMRGIIERVGFEVFSGKYYRVKPASVEAIMLSHDPDHTTLQELTEIRSLLTDRTHTATIEIKDYRGAMFVLKRVPFRED